MKKVLFILFAAFFLYAGCKENAVSQPENRSFKSASELKGTWVEVNYEEDGLLLSRADNLCDDKYGFVINDDGKFIERKNTSWCGTPPVVYGDYEGAWEAANDSTLKISVGYWGGTINYSMQILSISPNTLKVRYLYDIQ